MRRNEVDWADNKKKEFKAACVFGSIRIICLLKAPLGESEKTEREIENILEHEVIHITISKIDGERASTMYDNIFPSTEDLRKFID